MSKGRQSDYTYTLIEGIKGGAKIISIIDEDKGGVSVTNNIREVVMDICMSEGWTATDCLVVYRDSRGIWDGWDTENNTFYHIGAESEGTAVAHACLINQIEDALDLDTWEEL